MACSCKENNMAKIRFKKESVEKEIAANPAARHIFETEGEPDGDTIWLHENSLRKFNPAHPVFQKIEQLKRGQRPVRPTEKSLPPAPAEGPGTELKRILERFGFKLLPNCKCRERMEEMNRRGVAWCEENQETIIGWMKEESDRRGIPFFNIGARAALKMALYRARRR